MLDASRSPEAEVEPRALEATGDRTTVLSRWKVDDWCADLHRWGEEADAPAPFAGRPAS